MPVGCCIKIVGIRNDKEVLLSMCGICGVFSRTSHIGQQELTDMTDRIVRRGPDDSGYYLDDIAAMGMRRLSIQDVEGGKQPIFSECENYVVVFNGEIYNFKALTRSLEKKGYNFKTHTDTEVLIHLYSEYGLDMLEQLQGMFGFSIWDKKLKRAFIARDRLGIKPIFYFADNDKLIYGSELKSVLAYPGLAKKVNYQAIDAFLKYTFIPAPLTAYKNIHKLLPGHYMLWQDGDLEICKYWDVSFGFQEEFSESVWQEKVEEVLSRCVKSHLESDVPVGAFLSGGIDSGLITALMTENKQESFKTFTMGMDGKKSHIDDERPYARMLAKQLKVESNEFSVQPDAVAILPEVVQAFDEPFADDSVFPSYYISKFTAESVKVALSGLGGDELFAGYSRYEGMMLSQWYDHVPLWLRKHLINPIVQRLPDSQKGAKFFDHLKRFSKYSLFDLKARYLGYISSLDSEQRKALYTSSFLSNISFDETDDLVGKYFDRSGSDNLLDKLLYTDLKTYLPDDILALSDRIGMWHSLELRVPFVDHQMVELSARIPAHLKIRKRDKKYLLKRVARKWLPKPILEHKKQGFEAPMAGWLRAELKDTLISLLLDGEKECHALVEPKIIKELVDDHLNNKSQNNKILFSLIMLQSWLETSGVEL